MKIFHDNIALISLIDKSFGVRAIFVPDIIDYNRLTLARPYTMPFVPDRDIHRLMDQMFAVLKTAAEESGATYLPTALSQDWGDAEFLDQGHFNASGSAKFAKAIADDVRRLCQ
jgi:lysophospholipase L1-like esterase